jgi:hypothetical protein
MNPASEARRPSGRTGQALAEFTLALPVLLMLVLGLVEVSRAIELRHALSSLTREGANAASRGSSLDAALAATRANQEASGLGSSGGAIASRVRVEDGVPWVVEQASSPGFEESSLVGLPDSIASPYLASGLTEDGVYYVMELFLPYHGVTGLDRLFRGMVPETLYDRTLF